MAVSFGGTHCIKFGSQGDAVTGMKHITYVRWIGGTTAGHKCYVTDTGGSVFFPSEADGANFTDIQPIFGWRNGITLLSLGSGTVYVYTM